MFAAEPELAADYVEPYGDRQTELVLIGQRMDRAIIEQELDHCLLTDEEMTLDWSTLRDTLPGNEVVTFS